MRQDHHAAADRRIRIARRPDNRDRRADIAKLPPYRRDIGLVFQDYALFPHMSVAGNIITA